MIFLIEFCEEIVGWLVSFMAYQVILIKLCFSLVSFYGISTIVGYLMPNPFYTYKHFYFKQFCLALEQFFVFTQRNVKNSSISNNSINHQSFIYTQLNLKTVQFSISTLFKCQNSSISNNSV